jgi:hypothetical protein
MKIKSILLSLTVLFYLQFLQSLSAQVVYSEDFNSDQLPIEGGVGAYSFGYDKNQDTTASSHKELRYGVWNRQASAEVSAHIDVDSDGDLEIRPNDDTKTSGKLWGTLIDPSTFASTGSGTYTFSVDIIGTNDAEPINGASKIYIYSASGYDGSGSNDLIFDAAEGGLVSLVPFQGSGTTVVNEILVHTIDDKTASGNYSYTFTYTAGDALGIAFGSYDTAIAFDNISISYQPDVIYSENFDSDSLAILGGVGKYSFGYDKNNDTATNAYKALNYGNWVRQAPATISANIDVDGDGDKEIRPNDNGKNNAKMWGTLIDPSTFASTGSGTYTFSVDYIGADEGASRIYVYSASGFDASGQNDLVLQVSNGGLNYTPLTETTGTTVVNEIFTYVIPDTTTSDTYSVEFTYTAGDAIAIVFGSYNSAIAYDNLTIRPYSGDDIDADGLETSVETGTGIFVDATNTGTDPNNPDTDGDGLNDGDEVNTHGTNPNLSDTDGDGLSDSEEIDTYTTNPLLADSNNDGLEDGFLVNNGFDPTIDFSALITNEAAMNEIGYSTSPGVATVEDVRLNSVTISNLDGTNSRLQLKLERSSDQVNWSHDSNDTVNIDLPKDGGQQFYRITLPQN